MKKSQKSETIIQASQSQRIVQINMVTDLTSRSSKHLMHPNYQQVRANVMEFGCAGKSVLLLRRAFERELKYIKDPQQIGRLQKLLMKIIKSDPVHARGERSASNGDLSMLKGFEFNPKVSLEPVLATGDSYMIDRAAGKLSFTLPAFTPAESLLRSEGYTSYKLIFAAAEIDFKSGTATIFSADLKCENIDYNPVPGRTLTIQITPNTTNPVFVVIGIQYIISVNEAVYFDKSAHNSLTMLRVDVPESSSDNNAGTNAAGAFETSESGRAGVWVNGRRL